MLLAAVLGALNPATVRAQQLWSVENVSVRPAAHDRFAAPVALPSSASGPNADAIAKVASVQVEFDYLRLGMGYLELPLADGSVIEAENAVFEDRGGGNLMWTGEVPGAGYESVLFTVQDGHLVGWFGEPGGPKYTVHAGPDGRGTVAVEQGPTGDWCGVSHSGPHDAPRDLRLDRAAAARDRPEGVVSASNGSRLDILALYPRGTELYWRVIGGPSVGIRQLEDYLNMVFRNGEIPATANLIAARWDPPLASHPNTQGWHFVHGGSYGTTVSGRGTGSSLWHWEFAGGNAEVERLRERHEADLVHFLPEVGTARAAGVAFLRTDLDPGIYYGWSDFRRPYIFAHEIGHNLGGRHAPESFGGHFPEVQRGALRPYVFGHYLTCLHCRSTIMAGGGGPYYSSVRYKPNGWTIGVAGTSEVERLFHETVPVATRSGEAAGEAEQYPRTISARWTGRDSVRVTWSERDNRGGVFVALASAEGANDKYFLRRESGGSFSDPFVGDEDSSENLTPVLDESGVYLEGVKIEGLRPGGRYRLAVRGRWQCGDDDCTELVSPSYSDVFHLSPPRASTGAPAAPERLSAQVTGKDGVRLTWAGDSPSGGGFEVWYRKWSGEKPHETWRRYGGPLPPGARSADVRGLTTDEEIPVMEGYWFLGEFIFPKRASGGRYSFVVVAHNDKGFRASEALDFQFVPGPYLEPTASGEVTDCYMRSTVDLDGYVVWVCVETPDGARQRAWDYGLDSEQSGLLYFFGRDNAEVLVKVLDGCAVNGHRWVFVAPVTTLSFRLVIEEPGPYVENRRQSWSYDSKRRPQDEFGRGAISYRDFDDDGEWTVVRHEWIGNPQGRTARTVSDTTAFPCTAAEIAAAKAKAADAAAGYAAFLRSRGVTAGVAASARGLAAGARTDCEPGAAALTLAGGYKVSMCYETYAGETGAAVDYGLESSQSGLLYFFERDNAEVLIKVLDGCGVNGHRWVFVAPVTDLAFNLRVESPDGRRWTHANRLGQTADAASDVAAFPCSISVAANERNL